MVLKQGERIDDLQYKGLRIIQNPKSFCFGTDAILLSSFIEVRKNERVVDFCTGSGIIPVLLSARETAKHIWGIEIQEHMADMAKRSIELNDLLTKITIVQGDIRTAFSLVGGVYDVVTVNPPYESIGSGAASLNESERIARHEVLCSLDEIVMNASKILKTGGRFYIIHRIQRMIELIETMVSHRIEPKRIRLIHPAYDKAPNYILMEGRKNSNKGLVVEKPLFVYDTNHEYTQEVKEIYHLV